MVQNNVFNVRSDLFQNLINAITCPEIGVESVKELKLLTFKELVQITKSNFKISDAGEKSSYL